MEKLTELIMTIKKGTEEIRKENTKTRSEIRDLKKEWIKKQEI